jgi:hypothetical protein
VVSAEIVDKAISGYQVDLLWSSAIGLTGAEDGKPSNREGEELSEEPEFIHCVAEEDTYTLRARLRSLLPVD